ncbi:MAG: hypothetical protein AAF654_04145 [Myxococcota bacterium]
MRYRYSKKRGAIQDQSSLDFEGYGGTDGLSRLEAAPMPAPTSVPASPPDFDKDTGRASVRDLTRRAPSPAAPTPRPLKPRRIGMFWTTVDDGTRALRISRGGKTQVIVGPKRVWSWGYRFQYLQQYVAHPGEFLIVRMRNGVQEHVPGPAELWFDPRVHLSVEKEESLPIDTNEAVVAYTKAEDGKLERRVLYGPTMFVPQPGEWLHTFSWHGSQQASDGSYRKVPHGLVFQKLWLLPDQLYHDVEDVRTSDGAVLTIKLMIFFELDDIDRMLDATHDPIGDFVNAASSDVVDFVGRHDFNGFKQRSDRLNELETYAQLAQRAAQTGYRISKIVYRGYRAPENIQEMHDAAIESRTRLALERETEQQAQELEDYKLERRLTRDAKERDQQLERAQQEREQEAKSAEMRREQRQADAAAEADNQRRRDEMHRENEAAQNGERRQHLDALKAMGVDLTAYLTQHRADQVIEVRGNGGSPHVHLGGS